MNVTKMQRLVLQAIQEDPRAADDDAVLLAKVYHLKGWDDTRGLYENLKRMPRAESITRRRRELIAAGLVHPSKEATKQREEAFTNELEMHSSYKAVPWL